MKINQLLPVLMLIGSFGSIHGMQREDGSEEASQDKKIVVNNPVVRTTIPLNTLLGLPGELQEIIFKLLISGQYPEKDSINLKNLGFTCKQMLQQVLGNSTIFNDFLNKNGKTLMEKVGAAYHFATPLAKQYINTQIAHLNGINNFFYEACREGQEHLVRILLKLPGQILNVNHTYGMYQFNPLMAGVMSRNKNVLQLLLEDPRVNIDQTNLVNQTAHSITYNFFGGASTDLEIEMRAMIEAAKAKRNTGLLTRLYNSVVNLS